MNTQSLFYPILRGLVILFAILTVFPPAVAAPSPSQKVLEPVTDLQPTDVDVSASKVWVDGALVEGDFKNGILSTIGIASGEPWAAIHWSKQQSHSRIQYLVALKRSVKFHSLLFQRNGTLRYLRNGAELPANPDASADWVDVSFPPNQSGWKLATVSDESKAFLCTVEKSPSDWFRFTLLRVLAARWHNIVPEGIANADAEYTRLSQFSPPERFRASHITEGSGRWQSHGPDMEGRVPRAPVSDVAPTWFVVSWDQPREISAILLNSNFKKLQAFTYQGPNGINPATAPDSHWERIKTEPRPDGAALRFAFPAQSTRGLKFIAESTGGSNGSNQLWGAIDGLLVLTDLKTEPVPVRLTAHSAPPLTIKLNLSEKRTVSMAVDSADGRRLRNFPARTELESGEHAIGWDLKDDTGNFVMPGTYNWKAITSPGLRLQYEMTPYPNVAMVTKDNAPWQTGESGPGGWLADHTPPRAVCAAGLDRVFIGAPTAESGVALIECDLQGRKQWGHHNIIAWTGPSFLASDGKDLYAMPQSKGHFALKGQVDPIWRFTLPDKKLEKPFELTATANRRRGTSGMAVREGKLYLAVNASTDWMENAFPATDVDLDQCEPKYAKPPKSNKYDDPDRRADFLRILRLNGTPPGCNGLTYLETSKDAAARQHIVIALEREAAIGSFVFPLPETKNLRFAISILKPNASYPPNPQQEDHWIKVYKGQGKGWTVAPAPENAVTRAIRLSFDLGLDEFDEALLGEKDSKAKAAWLAQLEGIKILRRRFENLFTTCTVKVSSGTVSPEGEWDAQRQQPLSSENPGIYQMEWKTNQSIRGLAIKEIDGRFTEIDAWTGTGAPDMHAKEGWEKLSTYEQKLRYYYQPDQDHNSTARYMDGYVDFGRDVSTKALRLRVTEQWMWKEKDRAGVVGVRKDRGGQTLDPTRCRIFGVAPLKALSGEPPVDSLATQRIEVYDLASKTLLKELPFPEGGGITFGPDGTLYGLSQNKVVQINVNDATTTTLSLDVQKPSCLTLNKSGDIIVFDAAPDQRIIRIFDRSGKPLRTIGKPGGRIVGPYDPHRFTSKPNIAVDLAVDALDQLWVVECDYAPKRVSLWSMDGTFKKDLLGNTGYGGGGCLNPYDKAQLFYQGFEFSLDWKSGDTALKHVLWQGDTPAGEHPIRIQDRLYLVTRPSFTTQPVGIVYRLEDHQLKRVAAVGAAGGFAPLRTSPILEKLGKKALGSADFIWGDRNADGIAQADEVEFFDAPANRKSYPGRFDETLGIDAQTFRYEVKEFLPNGVPIYQRLKKDFSSPVVQSDKKTFFTLANSSQMSVLNSNGQALWTHPSEAWGVQAITSAKRPWFSGQAVAQFDVIGHETTTKGDLGEFFVTNSNCGTWHVWSADGLLVGRIFRDLLGPDKQPWSMREHNRGLDITAQTVGQEHFSGFFCKTREDGKYYAVAGHNHISIVEVQGFDQFKRESGTLQITKEDVAAAMEWDRQIQSRRLYESAKVIECPKNKRPIKLDGDPSEWEFTSATLNGQDASLAMSYDDSNLYLCFRSHGAGPLKNSGRDWRRLFKTGAAVDINIGLDAKADPRRSSSASGDTRLLMTMAENKPTVVLYQPKASNAKPDEAWETRTDVATSSFDRVAKLSDAQLIAQTDKNSYCVEAVIPLKSIGLRIDSDSVYKFDWGVLVSGPDGNEVMQRVYWANTQTAVIADEAIESQLHPNLWGIVRFLPDTTASTNQKQSIDDLLDGKTSPPKRGKQDLDDLLDDVKKAPPKPSRK